MYCVHGNDWTGNLMIKHNSAISKNMAMISYRIMCTLSNRKLAVENTTEEQNEKIRYVKALSASP